VTWRGSGTGGGSGRRGQCGSLRLADYPEIVFELFDLAFEGLKFAPGGEEVSLKIGAG
jgi:hypothetical protein